MALRLEPRKSVPRKCTFFLYLFKKKYLNQQNSRFMQLTPMTTFLSIYTQCYIEKFRIAQIIVYINLTDAYIYHLNRFNFSNCWSKRLGYFSWFSSRMGNRVKSTTHYSLHTQSLEKWYWIDLYHYPN